MTDEKILTEAEAAKHLLVKPNTLAQWRRRKRGPAYTQIVGRFRYALRDIQLFLEQSRVDPAQQAHARPKRRRRSGRLQSAGPRLS